MRKNFFNIVCYAISFASLFLTFSIIINLIFLKGTTPVMFTESNLAIILVELVLISISIVFIGYKMYQESIAFWNSHSKSKHRKSKKNR